MESEPEIAPVSKVFEALKAQGYDIGFDKWQRWVSAGLLPGSVFIDGTNVRGLDGVAQRKLHWLLDIEHWLDREKTSAPEFAFWMTYFGDKDQPAELVAEHIESGVKSLACSFRRLLKLRRGDDKTRREKIKKRLLALAQSTGKLQSQSSGIAVTKQSFIAQALGRFYESFILSYLTNGSLAFLDKPLLGLFLMFAKDRKAASDLKGIALEGLAATRGFLRDPQEGENTLVISIRKANRDSRDEIAPICGCASYLIGGIGHIFDALANPEKHIDQLGTIPVRLIKYKLPVACAGILMHMRGDQHARRMLAQMASGEFGLFNEQFRYVSAIKDDFQKRFGDESAAR